MGADGGALVIEISDLEHRYGSRAVFADVNAVVGAARTLVLAGANGSGKSTLLRILAGLLVPAGGHTTVRVGGTERDRFERRRHLGYVAPDLTLYRELT